MLFHVCRPIRFWPHNSASTSPKALWPMAWHTEGYMQAYTGNPDLRSLGTDVPTLVALLVCLIPTTIGGLLSAIGIAGMDRVMQHNVLAMSGKAVEAAGDVNSLLLDKTGTITLGNRQAVEFIPLDRVEDHELADAAQLSSLADETPEGRSAVVFAKTQYGLRERHPGELASATWVPFTAQTRMSGVDLAEDGAVRRIRKGAATAVMKWVRDNGGRPTDDIGPLVDGISASGGTPLVVFHQGGTVSALDGAVIAASRDVGAAAAVSTVPAGERAVSFFAAGGDVVFWHTGGQLDVVALGAGR